MRRPHVKRLLASAACLVLMLALAQGILAQATGPDNVATKLDEFEQLGWCDLTARLDNFAITLQQSPGVRGYVIAYGPRGDKGKIGTRYLGVLRDYLVNTRGMAEGRFQTAYGGRYKDLTAIKTELWIVPQGTPLPDPYAPPEEIEGVEGEEAIAEEESPQ